jgi:hypothetical protein
MKPGGRWVRVGTSVERGLGARHVSFDSCLPLHGRSIIPLLSPLSLELMPLTHDQAAGASGDQVCPSDRCPPHPAPPTSIPRTEHPRTVRAAPSTAAPAGAERPVTHLADLGAPRTRKPAHRPRAYVSPTPTYRWQWWYTYWLGPADHFSRTWNESLDARLPTNPRSGFRESDIKGDGKGTRNRGSKIHC